MGKKIVTEDGEIRDAPTSPNTGDLGIQLPFFKTPFNHDTNAESNKTSLVCADPTRTQQHQAEEADINTIVRRFGVTGTLPQVNLPPTYGDFTNAETYEEQLNVIARANASFYGLPADIRAKFQNDPGKYTTHVNDALEAGDLKALNDVGLELKERPGEQPKLQPKVEPPLETQKPA